MGARSPTGALGCSRGGVPRRVHGAAGREHRDADLPPTAVGVRHEAGQRGMGLVVLLGGSGGAARPLGRWAAARGRKLLSLYGFGLFSLASAGCALAPTLGRLVAGRGIQAVGAALLQANSVALVVLSVPRSRVRTALGFQGAAQALGLALGPTLGGVLVDAYGWRSVFWVNVPIGVLAIVAGYVLLPRSRDVHPGRGKDVAGFVLLAAAIVSSLLVLSGLSGMPLPSAVVVGLCVVAVVTVVLFWRTEARAVAPLVDTSLLRSGGLGASLAGALLAYLLLFAPLVLYRSLFATWVMSTAAGGLVLSCLPAGFALAAVGANVLHLRASNRQRVAGGATGVFACVVTNIALWRSPGLVAVLLLLMGAFLGLVIPANNATVMAAVPASASAVTGGMVNVARALGTALALSHPRLCAMHPGRIGVPVWMGERDGKPEAAPPRWPNRRVYR